MTCELANNPASCFERRQRQLIGNCIPWSTIPCESCKDGRENAIKVFVPEPDDNGNRFRSFQYSGPPCPVCKKRRPTHKKIDKNRPCYDCQRNTPEGQALIRSIWRRNKKLRTQRKIKEQEGVL